MLKYSTKAIPKAGSRLYSTRSKSPSTLLKLLKASTKVTTAVAITYGAGVYYASVNSNFHNTFTTYVPLAGTIIDFLEERDYQKKFKIITHKEAQKNSVPLTSAVELSTSSSSLASEQDELTKTKKVSANSSATSAKSNKDPLSPKNFFDAVSGTVGEEDREYLPLVLLPDDRDELVNQAAMSLNDLIAGYNASAITEETVLSVSKTLASLAQNSASIAPHYAQVIMHKSENFKKFYQGYQIIWDEYLEKQDENKLATSAANSLKANPVFADYNHRLAEEINETELLLVKFINAGKRGSDLDTSDAEYVKFQKIKSESPKKKVYTPLTMSSACSSTDRQNSNNYMDCATAGASKYDAAYGGFDGSDMALRVELALTLLVTALQHENTPVVATYIQGVRDAVATCPDDTSRESIINEALKCVTVPKDLDLRPVLHDIIFYDKHF